MAEDTSRAQERIYLENAEAYDRLIRAEDADGRLRAALLSQVSVEDKVVADIGGGTGRLTRWVAPHAKKVVLIDRAEPMLEVAAKRVAEISGAAPVEIITADARELPLADNSVDVAMAGWVFGHFRHWMPEGWRDEVDKAIGEMRRVATGEIVVIETLGTGYEIPRTYSALDEYFEHLENQHGLSRRWVRSDYRFESVEKAKEGMGEFFGDALVQKIDEHQWSTVPECTALFLGRA